MTPAIFVGCIVSFIIGLIVGFFIGKPKDPTDYHD